MKTKAEGNSWLTIGLKGVSANRFGVGATVELIAGEQEWVRQLQPGVGYHSYDQPIVHFGLGKLEQVDRAIVHWPGGGKQVVKNPQLNQHLEITQSEDSKESEAGAPSGDEDVPMFAESLALGRFMAPRKRI